MTDSFVLELITMIGLDDEDYKKTLSLRAILSVYSKHTMNKRPKYTK
jgi:hypothetical protein